MPLLCKFRIISLGCLWENHELNECWTTGIALTYFNGRHKHVLFRQFEILFKSFSFIVRRSEVRAQRQDSRVYTGLHVAGFYNNSKRLPKAQSLKRIRRAHPLTSQEMRIRYYNSNRENLIRINTPQLCVGRER